MVQPLAATSGQNSLAENFSRMKQEPPAQNAMPGAIRPPLVWYIGKVRYTRSVARARVTLEKPCKMRRTRECVMRAALGRPVVPDV